MDPLYHAAQIPSTIPTSPGIYRITCIPTGKIYVGSAKNLRKRYKNHFNKLRNGKHPNPKLQRAFNKYGADAFSFEVLELVLVLEFLTVREQHWFKQLNPFGNRGFNIAPNAGSNLGLKQTPEHTQKIRTALLGKPSPMRGIKRTHETIEKIKKVKQAKASLINRERVCENCGVIFFYKRHPEQRFCTRACYYEFSKKQIQRTCVVCGVTFERQPTKISPYCSAECSYQAMRKDISEAFWSKVDKTPSGCWLWAGGIGHGGLGLFKAGKKGHTVGAHRFSYEQAYGPIPDGMFVSHHCGTPNCVRPDHLFVCTPAENQHNKILKGHQAKGESTGIAKLTESDVRAIRSAPGGWGKSKALAKQYNVNSRTIYTIRHGKTWKHI